MKIYTNFQGGAEVVEPKKLPKEDVNAPIEAIVSISSFVAESKAKSTDFLSRIVNFNIVQITGASLFLSECSVVDINR